MDSLNKFFDLCKYNKFEKAIDACAFMFSSDKDREYAKELYRIYRDNNVPIEVCQKIIAEIDALNKRLNEKYGQ